MLSADEAAERLKADLRAGLTSGDAKARLAEYGPNTLVESGRRSALMMFFGQFRDFMILVLVAAALVSGLAGDPTDTVAILVIVLLNAAIGFSQEYRAEKAMEALKDMAAPFASVVRDSSEEKIHAADLVPGDLVQLAAGQVVPADMRFVEVHRLKVDESALTGESVPVEKSVEPVMEKDASIGDRACMAYKGTTVTYGRGAGVVTATGMATELGRIAALIQEEGEVKTPLQKRLTVFGRKLSIGILAICAAIFVFGLVRGGPVVLMFLTAVSLAVAAIPEALPAVVTITLALGAKRMVRRNALIRRLPAVEALGSVTCICTDKTGTVTMNRMSVKRYYADGSAFDAPPENPCGPVAGLLGFMAMNNDARQSGECNMSGDPTEVALCEAASIAGFPKGRFDESFPRVAEAPFDSRRKLMSTLHRDQEGGYLMVTKGALESVLGICRDMLTSGGTTNIDADEVRLEGEKAASEGYRVIAFGFRRFAEIPVDFGPEHENGLTFAGFAGMIDPPREEVRKAVSECASAGIRVVMITGDHPLTASKIALETGISGHGSEALTGIALASMSAGELRDRSDKISVYARVAPEQKLDIVQALKESGHIVAMTGDGVNDAPALKRADIGVSMGISGTDVARESSDIVLLDDNFASIVGAVREGRRIYDNIRKFIRYAMASNSGEIWTLFLAPLLGLPMPLLPIQILWINLVTDGLPGLSLAVEPEERNLMERPPRPPDESVFAHGLGTHIVWVGLLMGGACVAVQGWAVAGGREHWQSIVFTALCLAQMGHVLAIRSETESLFSQGLFSNKPLLFSVALTVLLQMAVLYVPTLNPVFNTQPLSLPELGVALSVSVLIFTAVEVEKAIRRKRPRTHRSDSANA